jgi:phosphoglycerate dehydrogenase-like enzyme
MTKIVCNVSFPPTAQTQLMQAIDAKTLVFSEFSQASNLTAGAADPLLAQAEIVFGQPDPSSLLSSTCLRWVHLTSAGYTRYDTPAFREHCQQHGIQLTTSSHVYADPCAHHVLAMMLTLARQLPASWLEQQSPRAWSSTQRRASSFVLTGQAFLILGYGAIAQRLCQLLQPFSPRIWIVRQSDHAESQWGTVIPPDQITSLLPTIDHVVNTLPERESTLGFFHAQHFAHMAPHACFYNVGRGTTIDQNALIHCLEQRTIQAAYLDVCDPEPLPKEHPLWSTPNCYLTPHSAGGQISEQHALVHHFLANWDRWQSKQSLLDRVL